MPPKKRGKKKCKEDSEKLKQKLKLEALIKEFDEQIEDDIDDMTVEAEDLCDQIKKRYALELKGIPAKFHRMTLKEIEEMDNKTPPPKNAVPSKYVSAFDSCISKIKSMSERRNMSVKRKKNASIVAKSQTNKKISTSTASLSRNGHSLNNSKMLPKRTRTALADVQQKVVLPSKNSSSNVFRKGSSTSFMTKKSIVQPLKRPMNGQKTSLVVTPKFNPRAPLPKTLLRAPKVGEVIMSLSGSPLQNPVPTTSNSKEPGLLLSLGNGKVLDIAGTKNLNLEASRLDQRTKETLLHFQQKLAGILRA